MMSPDLELITAAVAALRDAGGLETFVGSRIYDRVPEKPAPTMPYIAIGPTSSIPDDVDCVDAEELTIQFDVFSTGANAAYSSAECRKITDLVKRTLHRAELALADNALVTFECVLKRISRDPDGVTNHGVLQFTAIVETP